MVKINARQSEIYELVKQKETLLVRDILPMFQVSAPTIRKDLSVLEDAGMIVRMHGEVRLAMKPPQILPFEIRSVLHQEAKIAIAREAVKYINEGDSILLDSGSTTLEIAKLLIDYNNLMVVTNSLPIAAALSNSTVSVNVLGGILFGKNLSLQGPDAEDFLQRIEVNKAFISSSGIRPNYGLVASQALEASVKKRMIQAGKVVFAVLDSYKLQQSSVYPFAAFQELDYLITEKEIENDELKSILGSAEVNVLVADKTQE